MIKFLFWIWGCFYLIYCSPIRKENIPFDLYLYPREHYQEVKILGIPPVHGLAVNFQNKLVQFIQTCGDYEKTIPLKDKFPWEKVSTQDEALKNVDAYLKTQTGGLYSHGLFSIKIDEPQVSSSTHRDQLIQVSDALPITWHDGYGDVTNPNQKEFSFFELSPEVTLQSKNIVLGESTISIKGTNIYFNRFTKDKIIFSELKILSDLWTYSKTPKINPQSFKLALINSLLKKSIVYACPKIKTTSRLLYASGDESSLDKQNQLAVDLAKKGMWLDAVKMWEKIILTDPDYQIAHNNLGVYYEIMGQLGDALNEYSKAYSGKTNSSMSVNQYTELLNQIFPSLKESSVKEPVIKTVTSTKWVIIDGENLSRLKTNEVYSVFKPRTGFNEKMQEKITLIEAGKIKIVPYETSNIKVGRVVEYLKSYPIERGDIILLED